MVRWAIFATVLLHHLVSGRMYEGYKMIRFDANERIADWLESMEDFAHDLDEKKHEKRRPLFDVLSEPNKIQPWAEVVVAPDFYDTFLLLLKKQGVHKVKVVRRNIQKLINEESHAIEQKMRRKKRATGNAVDDFDAENYHPYYEMVEFLKGAGRDYPNLVKTVNISTSFEGRPIFGVKLSTSSTFKPAIVIDAGVHAREWVAPAAALYAIKKLIKSYGTDPAITKALQDYDWFIIPQLNPDGYEYSRQSDRLWRKTRSKHNTSRFCFGADANRNWGYKWGEAGAIKSACSNIFPGPFPFSEPEIVGLRDFLTWDIPDLNIYISLHSYGQVWLAPWGYTSVRPRNYADQRDAAHAAVDAIKKRTGAHYKYGTISEVMYPASGTSIDYLQDKNVPYIYGVELRPSDVGETYGFNIPPQFIRVTGDEMLEGVLAVAAHSAKRRTAAEAA